MYIGIQKKNAISDTGELLFGQVGGGSDADQNCSLLFETMKWVHVV